MRYCLFLLVATFLWPVFPNPIYAEALPYSDAPPPVERPKTKQRLRKAYKKRLMRRLHPTATKKTMDGFLLTFILFWLLDLVGIGAAIWGFFLFAGLGPIILLIANLVLDVVCLTALYGMYQNGILAQAFSLGLLINLPVLWISGLVVLVVMLLLLLFATPWTSRVERPRK